MLRYDLELVGLGFECMNELVEREEGEWIRFEDYAVLEEALKEATRIILGRKGESE